jgi:hypothetical protein
VSTLNAPKGLVVANAARWGGMPFQCRRRFIMGNYGPCGAQWSRLMRSPEILKRVFCSVAPQYPASSANT